MAEPRRSVLLTIQSFLQVLLEAARQRCCESSFLDAKDWKGRTALCYALRLADETTVKAGGSGI